jgi:hypothetical protein
MLFDPPDTTLTTNNICFTCSKAKFGKVNNSLFISMCILRDLHQQKNPRALWQVFISSRTHVFSWGLGTPWGMPSLRRTHLYRNLRYNIIHLHPRDISAKSWVKQTLSLGSQIQVSSVVQAPISFKVSPWSRLRQNTVGRILATTSNLLAQSCLSLRATFHEHCQWEYPPLNKQLPKGQGGVPLNFSYILL